MLAVNTFFEDENAGRFNGRFIDDCPTQRIRPQIETQRFHLIPFPLAYNHTLTIT